MIEYALLVALGFLLAGMLTLLFAGPFWRRAVRLTTKRLETTLPMSLADIQADKDQLRAEYAVEIRRLEMAHDREKEHAARYLVERNKYKVEIAGLASQLAALNAEVEERRNENVVLEQTISKKIPDLRQQLERAGQIIGTRDRELVRMKTAYDNQTEALGVAKNAIARSEDEIEQLQKTLDGNRLRVSSEGEGSADQNAENQRLQAEISRLRQKVGKLKEEDASNVAALKKEMHELSDRMLKGLPIKPATTIVAAPEPAPSDAEDKPDESADKKKAKPASGENKSDRKTKKPSRTSLSDRLKKLAVKADA